ncbi:MAG: hypothetical protein KH282_08225 [Clostridiales bacterium]|nr:hypothetical protein [Clostridiales bacterium]
MNKNINLPELEKAVKSGRVDSYLKNNVSSDAAKRIKDVLSSKEATEKLLQTKEAQALLKKLTEGKK